MKRILALDLATETGFAVQRAGGGVVTGVFVCLKSINPGARWVRFHDWLSELVDFEEPQMMIFEEPFIHMKHRTGLGISYGFKTLVEMAAAERGIRCYSIAPTKLKAWATGHGNASKDQMLTFARSMGWNLSNDNEIDARFLLHYAQTKSTRAESATKARA